MSNSFALVMIQYSVPAALYLAGAWYLHRMVSIIQKKLCPACRTKRCIDCNQFRDATKRLGG